MPTVISHAVAAAALASAFPASAVPRRLILLGAACAMAPDLDVLGFRLGIRYGDLLGHRGLTHSVVFAAALSSVAWLAAFPLVAGRARRVSAWLYLFLCTVSHGLLDAFTDGGLGVAFFAPFDTARHFFPFRPIEVSPIGSRFFSDRGVSVLRSELVWVWLPCAALVMFALLWRRVSAARPALQRTAPRSDA